MLAGWAGVSFGLLDLSKHSGLVASSLAPFATALTGSITIVGRYSSWSSELLTALSLGAPIRLSGSVQTVCRIGAMWLVLL
jgi:hypothetical protein